MLLLIFLNIDSHRIVSKITQGAAMVRRNIVR